MVAESAETAVDEKSENPVNSPVEQGSSEEKQEEK